MFTPAFVRVGSALESNLKGIQRINRTSIDGRSDRLLWAQCLRITKAVRAGAAASEAVTMADAEVRSGFGVKRPSGRAHHPVMYSLLEAAVVFGIVFAAASFCVGVVATENERTFASVERERLVGIAEAAAALVDVPAHETLRDPSDQDSSEYRHVVRPLERMREHTADIAFIYTAITDGGVVRFVVDAIEPGDHDGDGIDDQAKVMEVYEHPDTALIEALSSGVSTASVEPYTDRWGMFMTGFAPFFREDGSVAGVVGVDMSAERYAARLAEADRAEGIARYVAVGFAMGCAFGVFFLALSRRKSLAALTESEKSFRAVFDAVPAALFVCDADGVIQQFNDRAVLLWGREPESGRERCCGSRAVYLPDGTRVTPDESPLYRVLRTGEPELQFEAEIEQPDGTRVPIMANFAALRDVSDRVTGVVTAVSDISELTRAHREARAKTEALDRYFESSLDMLCIATTDGHFVRLNREWESVLGYPQHELEGKYFLDLVHPDDRSATQAALSVLAASEPIFNFENRYRHRDGTYRWIEWRSFPDGQTIFASARDITAAKKASEDLKESEQRYRILIESADAIVWEYDTQTKMHTYVSPQAVRLGYPLDRWFDQNFWLSIVHPEDRDRAAEFCDQCVSNTGPRRARYRLMKSDGSPMWVEDIVSEDMYCGSDGGVVLRGVMIDVTAQMRAQEEIERLALVAKNTSNAVIITDARRRITWVNEGFTRITGYTAAEALGRNPGALLQCEDTSEETIRAMREACDRCVPFRGEILNCSKDGREYWLDINIQPLVEPSGRLTGFIAVESDITDQVAERDRLRSTFAALAEGVLQIGPSGELLSSNPAADAILGLTSEEVRNASLSGTEWRSVYPDGRPMPPEEFPASITLRTGRSIRSAVHGFHTPDGELKWISVSTEPVFGTDGEVKSIVASFADVTARKRAEDLLRDAQAEAEAALREVNALRSALDEHSIISVADGRGRIVDVNTGFCRISGYTREELIGQDHRLLNSGTHGKGFWTEVWKRIANGRPWRGEICNRRKDGSLYWVDSTIVPYVGAGGKVEKYVSIRFDITAQKAGEDRLAASERRNRAIVSALPDLMFWIDANGVFLDCEGSDGLYLPREHFIGKSIREVLPPSVAEPSLIAIAEALRTGKLTVFEYRLEMPDGEREYEMRVIRLTDDDVLCFARDVTERKQSERRLREARLDAENANRAKSEFLANVSHEIRTPLTSILGYAEVLRESELERAGSRSAMLQPLDTIRRAGEHLLAVINDVLDISKIEAGRLAIERVSTPIVALLHDVDSLMQPRARSKGVRLETRFETALPDQIASDPTRVRQILMNLVGNAIKFTEGGLVTVRVSVQAAGSGEALRFEIADTGAGITDEQAARLFAPFSQADGSITRKHGGTGLGLAISRRLAELLDGDVWLEWSEPGKGSCFVFEIPLHRLPGAADVPDFSSVVQSSSESPVKSAQVGSPLASRRILLAEDGVDNQRLITFHLSKAGADVSVAEHGVAAIEMLEAATREGRPFDLLLTDMQMPEMDGYTLARTLRDRGVRMPIVALTAHAMAEDRDRCIRAGCDDYASKPIDRSRLIDVCVHWIERGGNGRASAA